MKRVFAFIGFTFALTLFVLNLLDYSVAVALLPATAVLLITSVIVKNTRQARVLPIVFGSAFFACLIFVAVNFSAVLPATALDGQRCDVRLEIIDLPTKDENGYTYIARVKEIPIENAPQNIKIKLKTDEAIEADYYQSINANVRFYSINSSHGYNSDFSNSIYIRACLYNYSPDAQSGNNHKLNYHFIKLRENIRDNLSSALSEESGALVRALVMGDKSELSDKAYNDFIVSAMAHFIAVSGFHISFVCLGVYLLLKLVGFNKNINICVAVIIAISYCFVADFSKSVIRAVLMMSVLLISKALNSKADTLNSLGIALFIICLNPFAVTSAGTVMTVSAVLGIVAIAKPIINKIRIRNRFLRYIINSLVISISVLFALLPAFYIYFGNLSLLSILSNLIMEPLLSLLLFFGVVLSFIPAVPIVSTIIAFLTERICSIVLSYAGFCSDKLSVLFVDFTSELFGIMLAVIFIILAVMLIVMNRIPVRLSAVLISVIIAVTSLMYIYKSNITAYVVIRDTSEIVIYDKDSAVVIGDNKYDYYDIDRLVRNRNTIYIDCENYISNRSLSAESIDKSELIDCQLCEDIAVSSDGKIINVTVFDNVFKITDKYVIIDKHKFRRDTNSQYNNSADIVISFTENSNLYVDTQ